MSDGIIRERWGSHWRSRWALAAILLGLMVCAYCLAEQWHDRGLIRTHRGSTALVLVRGHYWGSIEAFDWAANRRYQVADHLAESVPEKIAVVRDDTAVAWRNKQQLHVVDIEPPHAEQVFQVPAALSRYDFLGLSNDLKFAAYEARAERQTNADGTTSLSLESQGKGRQVFLLAIADLSTGEVVDTREWESGTWGGGKSGEFESMLFASPPADPNEPLFSHWTISPEGKWQQLDSSPLQPKLSFPAARSASGQWRLLDANETAGADETSAGMITFALQSGKWVLAYNQLTSSSFLIDTESKAVRPLDIPRGLVITPAWLEDGETLVVGDVRDDIRVIHAPTGKLLAWEASGSQRRERLMAVGVALAALGLVWLAIAFREKSLFWGLLDSLIVVLAIEFAVSVVFVSYHSLGVGATANVYRVLHHGPRFVLGAGFLGTTVLVGWYWSHGQGRLLQRWAVGLLWLAIGAIPYALVEYHSFAQTRVFEWFPALFALGVLSSSAASLLTAVPRSMGWTIHAAHPGKDLNRFGLATFFVVLTGICVLIPIGQWYVGARQNIGRPPMDVAIYAWVFGVGLVAILFSRLRWYLGVTAAALLIGAMAAGAIPLDRLLGPPRAAWMIYTFLFLSAIGTIWGVALPCLVLRAHGWHWVQARQTAAVPEPFGSPTTA